MKEEGKWVCCSLEASQKAILPVSFYQYIEYKKIIYRYKEDIEIYELYIFGL